MNATFRFPKRSPVKFRIKGSDVYVEPVRAKMLAGAYTTTGTGPRSLRWSPPALGPNAALDSSLEKLRRQSQDMQRRSPLAASAIERVVSHVVGTGIRPKAPNDEIADLWNRWTEEVDAAGILDFYGLQAQAMRSVITSGEIFGRFRARRPEDRMQTVPFQVELLEAEFIDFTKNEIGEWPRGQIRQGVEFDPNLPNKRVAYWVFPYHPYDAPSMLSVPNISRRIPASEMFHVYLPMRAGQIRGEPWLARVLSRLLDLDAYDSAELVRKKTAALFAGFITRNAGDATIEELDEFWGNADEETGALGGVNISMEPGTMQTLAPGEEIQFSAPVDVGGMYEVFKRSVQRDIAAGIGALYEQVTGDYSNVNDRTWRAAVNDLRKRVEQWQHSMMVFQMCRPVWSRWVDMGILAGKIGAKQLDPMRPVPWVTPRWPYINPLQDIEAQEKEILSGVTSRDRVIEERGDDPAKIDAEQAAGNARADAAGLKPTSDGRHANPDPEVVEVEPGEKDDVPARGK